MERTFQESSWNSPEIMNKSSEEIIDDQLDIKLEQFIEKELDRVQKKIKSRKAAGLNKILPKVW